MTFENCVFDAIQLVDEICFFFHGENKMFLPTDNLSFYLCRNHDKNRQ